MALYTQASDLQTRQTIWVATNVVKGKDQANSHSRGWEFDGLPSTELADLQTNYQGWVESFNRYWCNPKAPRKSFPV